MEINRRVLFLTLFSGLIAAVFLWYTTAHAAGAGLTSQLQHEATSTTALPGQVQPFGTGYSSSWTGGQIWLEADLSAGGSMTTRIELFECSNSTYTGCTKVGYTGPITDTFSTGNSQVSYSLATSSPYQMNPAKYYYWDVDLSGITLTGKIVYVGTKLSPAPNSTQCVANCGGLTAATYVVSADVAGTQFGISYATSTSLFSGQDATSTLANLAQQCSQTGNIFAEGVCIAFSFLFVPDHTSLNNMASLPAMAEAKFPFSWIVGMQAAVGGMTASSTPNMIGISWNFAGSGMSSTSPLSLPALIPSPLTAFGTTTIETYISPGTWALFQTLIATAMWLTFFADVFFTTRNQMHRV